MGFIYKITNKVNGKIYIGQTMRTISVRWSEHVRDSGVNPNVKPCCNYVSILHKAIAKYGVDCFTVEEVEQCDNDQLNRRERYWIEYYQSNKSGYNIYLGGESTTAVSDNEILELWNKGYIIKEIASELGLCDDTISRRLKNVGITSKEILKRGNIHAITTRSKPVYQYDIDGNFIKEFSSLKEAQESIGGNRIKFHSKRCRIITTCGYQRKMYKMDKIDSVIGISKQKHDVTVKKHKENKRYTRQVVKISSDGSAAMIYNSIKEAAIDVHSVIPNIISSCKNHKIKSAGFFWAYLNETTFPIDMTSFGSKYSETYKPKAVHQYAMDGTYIRSFASMTQAQKAIGVTGISSIRKNCIGNSTHGHGYRWSFEKVDKLPPIKK